MRRLVFTNACFVSPSELHVEDEVKPVVALEDVVEADDVRRRTRYIDMTVS
jgi:hypothetical protein